jgi:glutamate dehydrogenase (NAD(P)+)
LTAGPNGVRVIELRDEPAGLDAFVVVDHELFPVSAGGTRMAPDVSVEEVARLARAMTWKFAALRLPMAGAKAGVRFAGDAAERGVVFAAYLRALAPYSGSFFTGPDLGTSPSDFPVDHGRETPLWALEHEGLGMDDLATGHGVKAAAERALRRLGGDVAGATVAIEGFGKVGAGTARAWARAGGQVVGVSTVHGLVADPGGLDVEALIDLRREHGDRFVERAGAPVRPREELFELDCDVVVPGARPDAVTVDVARELRCRVVAPGANVPYGAGAVEVLRELGIVALPDFVANAGGVHLYESVEGLEPAAALARIEELIGEATARVLARAEAEAVTPMTAALADARAWLEEQFPGERDAVAALFPA